MVQNKLTHQLSIQVNLKPLILHLSTRKCGDLDNITQK